MRLVCGLLMVLLFSVQVPANGLIVPIQDLDVQYEFQYEDEINELVHEFWTLTESFFKGEIDQQQYVDGLDRLYQKGKELVDKIIADLDAGNRESFDGFRAFCDSDSMKSHPEIRAIIDRFVTPELHDYLKAHRDVTPDEYINDYGYPEPGYEYRKGEELTSQVLSVYWKKIEKKYGTQKTYKIKIELDANGNANFNLGDIVQKGQKETLNIGGKMVDVQECTVTFKDETKTVCSVKFQKKKVYFNLYRKKSSWLPWFDSSEWELCGQTYDIFDEESGMPVVEKAGNTGNFTPDPTPDNNDGGTNDGPTPHHIPNAHH